MYSAGVFLLKILSAVGDTTPYFFFFGNLSSSPRHEKILNTTLIPCYAYNITCRGTYDLPIAREFTKISFSLVITAGPYSCARLTSITNRPTCGKKKIIIIKKLVQSITFYFYTFFFSPCNVIIAVVVMYPHNVIIVRRRYMMTLAYLTKYNFVKTAACLLLPQSIQI